MNEIIQLPAPIYPKLVEILREKEKAYQAEIEGIAAMANIYDQVCATLRNHEIKQDHQVRVYPAGVTVKITLDRNDILQPFKTLWTELYFILKPDASREEVTELTGHSWRSEVSATCRTEDKWLDLTLNLPLEGTRDHQIIKYEVPSTITRYNHHPLEPALWREHNWYAALLAQDRIPF